jgi:hypothetical protein
VSLSAPPPDSGSHVLRRPDDSSGALLTSTFALGRSRLTECEYFCWHYRQHHGRRISVLLLQSRPSRTVDYIVDNSLRRRHLEGAPLPPGEKGLSPSIEPQKDRMLAYVINLFFQLLFQLEQATFFPDLLCRPHDFRFSLRYTTLDSGPNLFCRQPTQYLTRSAFDAFDEKLKEDIIARVHISASNLRDGPESSHESNSDSFDWLQKSRMSTRVGNLQSYRR